LDALHLLSGDAQVFLDKIWASHIHVHRTDPADLVDLLSLDDVDHLLTSTALRTPALRLARNGTVLPQSSFTRSATLAGSPLTGLVDARKVLDLFEDGATVVLQGLHRYWAPLTSVVRELELALGHPCQANAYLTPPGSQGFAVHSDTHDVFVFQTHGSKQWEVHDESGAHEVLLEPGTSMYLPAGTPHAARAQDTASLHVTIGINQITWRQMLQNVVTGLLSDESYDAPVPAGYLGRDTGLASDFATGLAHHVRELATGLNTVAPEALVNEQVSRFLRSRTPILRGGLRDRLALPDVAPDTAVSVRPGPTYVLVDRGDNLVVLLGDREIRMPQRLAGPMSYIREQSAPFRPRDLDAWLDSESQLVLVRRLLREGLLQVEG